MTTSENLPRFDKPAAAKPKAAAPTSTAALRVTPAPHAGALSSVRTSSSAEATAGRFDDLHASRVALLAGRECKLAAPGAIGGTYAVEQDGHVARAWHICHGCFPDA